MHYFTQFRLPVISLCVLLILSACLPIRPESAMSPPPRISAHTDELQAANSAVVAAFVEEVYNQANFAVIEKLVDPNCIIYHPFLGELHGQDAIREWATNFRDGFTNPKLTFTVHPSGDDLVFTYWSFTSDDLAVDNTKLKIERAINLYRVKNGRIVEIVERNDSLDIARQLGIVPAE